MRIRRSVLVLLIVGLVLAPMPTPPHSHADDNPERIDALLEAMTLRQKIGQMFMVSIYGTQPTFNQVDFIQTYFPGALVLFGSNVDGTSPDYITRYINTFQQYAVEADGVPMFVAVDQEGGRVRRLTEGFTNFPDPVILGAAADYDVAYGIGQAMGQELRAVGFTMNLAPVADLHTREDDMNQYRVMHHRTISQDAEVVGMVSGAMAQGMASEGVVAVVKHYPGHNPTSTDSHRSLATVDIDRQTFMDNNFRAFQLAIEDGAEAIMVGHLYYPAIEPVPNLPASLSPTMLGLLRDEANFDGVLMTDAMEMGGIVTQFTIPDAAVMAVKAGIDMMAFGTNAAFVDQIAAMDAVYNAVVAGDIPESRIDEAARRILTLKAKHGLLDWQILKADDTYKRLDTGFSREALIQMFEMGTTVVRDEYNMLPLRAEDNVAIIYPIGKPLIYQECSAYLPNAAYQGYSFVPAEWEVGASQAKAQAADKVIVIAENVAWNQPQGALVAALPPEKTIFVSLWKPYDWEAVDSSIAGFVSAYSTLEEAQIALCRVIAGAVPANGRLPMPIRGYPLGHGITYSAIR